MKVKLKDTVIEASEARVRYLETKIANNEISLEQFIEEKKKNELETKARLKFEIEKIQNKNNIVEANDINWKTLARLINDDSSIFRNDGSVYNYRNSNIGLSVSIILCYIQLIYR